MRRFRQRMTTVIFFLCLFLTLYWLWNSKPHWDFSEHDNGQFYYDAFYRKGILEPFNFTKVTTNRLMDTYYSPLPTAFFNILWSVFGLDTKVFYTFVFLTHCLNSILVYFLAKALRHDEFMGQLSAAIFLFFPSNVQTLTWFAAGVVYSTQTLFSLISIIYFINFLNSDKEWNYSVSLCSFIGACLCKISAVALLAVLMLLDLLLFKVEFRDTQRSLVGKWLSWYEKYIYYLLVSFIFIAIAIYKYPTGETAQAQGGVIVGAITFLRLLEFITCLVFPFYLTTGRPLFLVITAFYLFLGLLLKGNSFLRYLTLWILISISPFIIYLFRDIAQNYRHFYMASVPLSLLISYTLYQAARKIKFLTSYSYVA